MDCRAGSGGAFHELMLELARIVQDRVLGADQLLARGVEGAGGCALREAIERGLARLPPRALEGEQVGAQPPSSSARR